MIRLWMDEDSGLLMGKFEGFISLIEAERYSADLAKMADRVRRREGRVLYLVDATDSVVQSAEITEALGKARSAVSSQEDKMAIVQTTALGTMQAKRLMRDEREQIFTSELEARAWLLA